MAHSHRSPIKTARQQAPYVDFQKPPLFGITAQDALGAIPSDKGPDKTRSVWTHRASAPGYGLRHVHDVASFSLWDADSNDFRYPTPQEEVYIKTIYYVVDVITAFPVIVIERIHRQS